MEGLSESAGAHANRVEFPLPTAFYRAQGREQDAARYEAILEAAI